MRSLNNVFSRYRISIWSAVCGPADISDWTVKDIPPGGTNGAAVTDKDGWDLTALGTNSLADISRLELEDTELSEWVVFTASGDWLPLLGVEQLEPGLLGVLDSLGFLRGELSIPYPLPRPLPAEGELEWWLDIAVNRWELPYRVFWVTKPVSQKKQTY